MGAERCSRLLQIASNPHCERVCAAEHAPRDPFQLLERRHCLADIVERGAGVLARQLYTYLASKAILQSRMKRLDGAKKH